MSVAVGAIPSVAARPLRAAALLAVLGVVYGDIGTSPLYAFKASLIHFTGVGLGTIEILGILSLIFWSLILIVTIKYVMLVMRADNHGEGGILALMALAQRGTVGTAMRAALALIGVGGACLFFGDGVITPPSRSSPRSKGSRWSRPPSKAWSCRCPSSSSWRCSPSRCAAPIPSAACSAR